jgi:hypothetical protein
MPTVYASLPLTGPARQAAEDPHALAYLGDFHSGQIAESSRILGAAGLLQVAPVATWAELGGPTLIRLMPHDGVGARAIADWMVGGDIARLLVVHDHDPYYGMPVGGMCVEAALARAIAVRSRPIWNHDEEWESEIAGAQAVLYVGVAARGRCDSGMTSTRRTRSCGCSGPRAWPRRGSRRR